MSNDKPILNPELHAGTAPTPPNYNLVRLHDIVADLEAITSSVELGEIMPTPADIARLLDFAQRMKVQAKAAGFEFPDAPIDHLRDGSQA